VICAARAVCASTIVAVALATGGVAAAEVAPAPEAAAAALADAVTLLLAEPEIAIDYRVAGLEGELTTGTGVVAAAAGRYALDELIDLGDAAFTHQRRLDGETLQLRDLFPGDDPERIPWITVDHGALAPADLAAALTARGRVADDLPRVVAMVAGVPFQPVADPAGRLVFEAPLDALLDWYRETGLEVVGDHGHEDELAGEEPVIRYAFELADGRLAALHVSGVVVVDGEPVAGASVEIHYARPAGMASASGSQGVP